MTILLSQVSPTPTPDGGSQLFEVTFASTMPLWAALIGVFTALVASSLAARATSINSQRDHIYKKYESVRTDLGRFQAIQQYVDITGYNAAVPSDIDFEELRTENYKNYFRSFPEETAKARAALARLNVRTGIIWSVVTSPDSLIRVDQLSAIWVEMDESENKELSQLERWWLPNPVRSEKIQDDHTNRGHQTNGTEVS